MTKLKVKVLETEPVEHKGAINQKIKEGGVEIHAYLVHIETNQSGIPMGYVYYKNDGEIKQIPLKQIRVVDEQVEQDLGNILDDIKSIFQIK